MVSSADRDKISEIYHNAETTVLIFTTILSLEKPQPHTLIKSNNTTTYWHTYINIQSIFQSNKI